MHKYIIILRIFINLSKKTFHFYIMEGVNSLLQLT